uniref:Putative carbohydrate-active enzyme n=1 Tax=uncultured organism TaxID=155900 RepID=E9NSL1_9ZZZZ|nr:putative carbohydrate-active enzyme [uncultured organism]
MKKLLTFTVLLGAGLIVFGCKGDPTLPRDVKNYDDPLMQHEKEISGIISKMTLEEKVAMLHGKHMFTSEGVPSQGIADMVYADGPFGIREEMEPHSWNSLHLTTDSATFFPTGSALAATWSDGIAYLYGTGMAREARLRGKDMILGPAINIQRIPTGGRTYEYLSEDPYLSSVLSVAYTKGVQNNGVAVCVKHFALNNQETNRGSVNVIVSPRAMREIYLPPFEATVVEGNAFGVMSAYNKINGYWCAENYELLNSILRKDWGFKGMVISDWGGTHSTVESVVAGLNVEMPNSQYLGQALLDSVAAGAVSEDVIDERVREILRVRLAVDPVPENKANVEMTAKPEQAQIAYQVALQSIVLLKNEGSLLPIDLNKVKTIAVIGDNADKIMATGGVGAGVKALYEITPLAGLKNRIGDKAKIVYAQGYTSQQARGGFGGFGGGFGGFGRRGGATATPAKPDDTAKKLQDEAVKVAKSADMVLFIGGDNRSHETEGSDRRSMDLPYNQENVLEAVAKVNPNVVFIAVAGAPVDLNRVQACCPAIVQSWFNGTEGGNALADILTGESSPSGRLPFSYPFNLEDSPAYATGSFPQTDAPVNQDVFVSLVQEDSKAEEMLKGATGRGTALYSEDMLVGYRWFDTKQKPVMYPFGYGLGYSEIEYSDFAADKSEYRDGEVITVTLKAHNKGKYVQCDVPQVYVHRVDSKIEWPYKELKGFTKTVIYINPDPTDVEIKIPVESLKYWDEAKHDWVLEPGKIELLLAHDAGNVAGKVELRIEN